MPVALVWYQIDGENDIKVPEDCDIRDIVIGQYNYVAFAENWGTICHPP